MAALQKEGEMPIEDLLATLPEALLSENAAPLTPSSVVVDDDDDEDDHDEDDHDEDHGHDDDNDDHEGTIDTV